MEIINDEDRQCLAGDIQGVIGAGLDDGGWIATAYLVAEIVAIPSPAALKVFIDAPLIDSRNVVCSWYFRSPVPTRAISIQMTSARPAGFRGGVRSMSSP